MAFIGCVLIGVFVLWIAPFQCFPDKMDGYGTYLTGVAAIGAALKFIAPYLLMLLYKKRYANELIWKQFLNTSSPKDDGGSVMETEWIAGLIGYFRRCRETLHKRGNWYQQLPYLADDVYMQFSGTRLIGRKEKKLFEEIKGLFAECGDIVAMNSTPNSPMHDDEKYQLLDQKFALFADKVDYLNKLLVDTPVPIKKIIEGNEFIKSFFPKNEGTR